MVLFTLWCGTLCSMIKKVLNPLLITLVVSCSIKTGDQARNDSFQKTTDPEPIETIFKPTIKFNQTESFDIIDFRKLANFPTSDYDTAQCSNWTLTVQNITEILRETEEIDGHTWHYLFGHYPCVYRGTIKQRENTLEFAINSGSWLTISSDTTIYYGDLVGTFKELFLDDAWDEEDYQ
jgi:hypothetical protein